MISIAFERFLFSWSKTPVGFIPNNLSTMYETLRTPLL